MQDGADETVATLEPPAVADAPADAVAAILDIADHGEAAEAAMAAGGGDTTDAPVRPDGEAKKAAPAKRSGPTPEELAEYDAETVRLVNEAEALARSADGEWEALKTATSEAKKRAEGKVCDLRDLIRARQQQRGREPEKTLLDLIPKAKWRGYDLDTIAIHRDVRKVLDEACIRTLGELYEQVGPEWTADSGPPLGLSALTAMELRQAVQRIIDAEFNATEEAGQYGAAVPDELWREYPIERWQRFGITAKDVEKLAAGEVKRETGRRSVKTVGDLSDFSKPTDSGYSRGYGDVKGIGTAGADRISDAETQFWAWWKSGGDLEFARERGLICGDTAGHPGDDASAGSNDRPTAEIAPFNPDDDGDDPAAGDGTDVYAGPGDAEGNDLPEEGFIPLDSDDTAGSFGGPGQAPGW